MKKILCKVFSVLEYLVFGGKLRERILLFFLSNYYQSIFRRQWYWGSIESHNENQRIFMFDFIFSKPPKFTGPYPFFRGFYDSEVIQQGDNVLDIGCGDGFFSMRFLTSRASSVDAIDVDKIAIDLARHENNAPNITYQISDAINNPFPKEKYDVITWEGAIGHFSKEDCEVVLKKISDHLGPNGIFVGSESIGTGGPETVGTEGHDHLQHFKTKEDISKLLKSHFKYVCIKEIQYPLSWSGGFLRIEAYWRCSNHMERLDMSQWSIC
jgi:2-polyprenyl-3-methyl-5-hydroxy-6-metoxy-1,4-benzoquinol methylase